MTWTDLLQRSYVPYSHMPFACVVEGKSGTYYPGVRIENGSYPLTIYAEQSALGFCYTNADEPVRFLYQTNPMNTEFWQRELDIPAEEREDISDLLFSDPLYQLQKSVREELKFLLSLAVTPESDFQVSCLIKHDAGYTAGVNIEFSDWQKGLCAERVALAICISSGIRNFDSLHLHASSGEFISPCGGCRQVIVEHIPEKRIAFYHPNNTKSEYNTTDLMPYGFSSVNLKKKPT